MSVRIFIRFSVGDTCLTFFFTGLIGRIWSIICKCHRPCTCILILTTVSNLGYNRYETHYGQEQSRLSRDCAILTDDSTEVQWTRTLLSLTSLRTSDRYLETLDALFVDKFVYAHAWTTFMSTCLKTWRRDCCSSAMLLLFVPQSDWFLQTNILILIIARLHILCFFHPVSGVLAYTSSLLASTSLLTGMLLIHRHEELEFAEAHEAVRFFFFFRLQSQFCSFPI